MRRAFDPIQVRQRLLGEELGLAWSIKLSMRAAEEPTNLFLWRNMLGEVVLSWLVGLRGEQQVAELLALVVDALSPIRWVKVREAARESSDRAHDVARGWATCAIARWLQTGELQPALFAEASAAYRPYFERAYGNEPKWRADVAGTLITFASAAGAHADVLALFERPQLAEYRDIDPAHVRGPIHLGWLLARQALPSPPGPDELTSASDRMLRHQIGSVLERGGNTDAAELVYLAAIAMREGDGRSLLARACEYVSYLAPKKPKPVVAPVAPRASNDVAVAAPIAPTPLPAIRISASVLESLDSDRAAIAPARWLEVATPAGTRWALRVVDPRDRAAARDERFGSVCELQTRDMQSLLDPALVHLERATPDGATLSALAARPEPCPLQVAFPATSNASIAGIRVHVTPTLTRGHWRAALAVGSLRHLRAVAFSARETARQRVGRGATPYAIAPAWFWQSRLAAQLEAIDVDAEAHPLASWRARFAELPRLHRVYVRVAIMQKALPWRQPLHCVIDRDASRIKLTLQCAVGTNELVADELATLFASSTRDDVSTIDFEVPLHELEDADTVADDLRAFGRVGTVRGSATLLEL